MIQDAVSKAIESGFLSLSEVASDKNKETAVMRFTFYCGTVCGRGGLLIYKKMDGKWQDSPSTCSLWMAIELLSLQPGRSV
jgi:hypothetical protein